MLLVDAIVGRCARKQNRLRSITIVARKELSTAHDAENDERVDGSWDRGTKVGVDVDEPAIRPAQNYKTGGAEKWLEE